MDLTDFFDEFGKLMIEAINAQHLSHLDPTDRRRLVRAIAELADLAEQVATYITDAQIDDRREEEFRQKLKKQTATIQAIVEKAEAL
jgi:hypothetical protein